jgi:hypothetical protein
MLKKTNKNKFLLISDPQGTSENRLLREKKITQYYIEWAAFDRISKWFFSSKERYS